MNLLVSNVKNYLNRYLYSIKRIFIGAPSPRYFLESYAQEGEDLVINRIFSERSEGFYVDVGAHHPKRYSNTYFFYQRGWSGINIDAMPNSMVIFNQERPLDINLELAIMGQHGSRTYFEFNEPALNGFSEPLSLSRDGLRDYKIINKTIVKGIPLSHFLEIYIPKNKSIDFLTIDIEGLDFEVLQSNDWKRFRPKVVLIEILVSNLNDLSDNSISKYLANMQYTLYAKTLNTVFFVSNEFLVDELC